MGKILEFIDGYKSKLVGVGVGVVAALRFWNLIDDEQTKFFMGLLGAGGMFAIKSAITKVGG